jgi:membrane-associated phospholipid phosphatase
VTGVLRIAARKHYFTDVVVGAAVGWGAGYLVPKAMWRGSRDQPTPSQSEAVTLPMAALVTERTSVSLGIVGGTGTTGLGLSILWR